MTRHPARGPAQPWTDPTDWRDELDDLRRMLAEAGRTGPLRDEIAQLLVEVGRGDRIVVEITRRADWVPGTRGEVEAWLRRLITDIEDGAIQ